MKWLKIKLVKKVKVQWTPAFQSYYSVGDEAEPYCNECETYLEEDNNYCPCCGSELDWGAYLR